MNTNNRGHHLIFYSAIVIIAAAVSPFIGAEKINPLAVLGFSHSAGSSVDVQIFWQLRIPRILLAVLAGGVLGTVGAAFQVILRNPLATPYTLGISGGAAAGAYIAIAFPLLTFGFGPFSTVQLFALAGGLTVQTAIYLPARRAEAVSMNTLLLAGVTIGILCGSVIMLLRYIAQPNLLVSMDRWIMGGLDISGYKTLAAASVLAIVPLWLIFAQSPAMNHLSLGHDMALGHGVNVGYVQNVCFVAGSIAVSAIVSVCGPIGFVGLIVPHIVRKISGYDCRIVLPGSFLAGAAFLVICDTAARTFFAPTEMPAGVITSLIGGPVFIVLLMRLKNI